MHVTSRYICEIYRVVVKEGTIDSVDCGIIKLLRRRSANYFQVTLMYIYNLKQFTCNTQIVIFLLCTFDLIFVIYFKLSRVILFNYLTYY